MLCCCGDAVREGCTPGSQDVRSRPGVFEEQRGGVERLSKVSQATGPELRAGGAARLFGACSHGENLGFDSE